MEEVTRKSYKDFPKVHIGSSEKTFLTMIGDDEDGAKKVPLRFLEDGCFDAYVVEGSKVIIGMQFTQVASFINHMEIYDDNGKSFEADAKDIIIYRAGVYGCIIQLIK